MTLPLTTGRVPVSRAVKIILGIVFLFSSAGKIIDPGAFAAIVANYQLLPPQLVTATAVVFPWVEALCGLALVCGWLDEGAALLIGLMMVAFIGITIYNGYRGLDIACGCFSLSAREPSSILWNTLRDLAILAAAVWVLADSAHRHPGVASRPSRRV
ncbi:MauE/DoxX family redox-associated membrane protein [Desulfosarcina ovata]|nr:MauE/DoxX family redox-associated membrane protein [Desulfosarcina ovata]